MEPVTRKQVADAVVTGETVGEVGKSGAQLTRVRLPDGRRLVVKRYDPEHDILMRLAGDDRGREVEMWLRGDLARVPPDVSHAIVGGWFEEGHGVLVMCDLGDAVLQWEDRLDAAGCRQVLHGVVALHRAYQGGPPTGLFDLTMLVGLFEPARIGPYRALSPLAPMVLRGWDYFPDLVPADLVDPLVALSRDSSPLAAALSTCTPTLVHGDLATVNMAFVDGQLTLIDWGMAAAAPGATDVGRFLAGCAHVLDLGPDEMLALYREEAGELYDARAVRLSLLAGLIWLGWNKALDIVEHPDPTIRERERAALSWWVDRARDAFDAGL
jgi:hypothetical protein